MEGRDGGRRHRTGEGGLQGNVLNEFPSPDLDGNGERDLLFGLAFDGTNLFAASQTFPRVAALDPVTGEVLATTQNCISR